MRCIVRLACRFSGENDAHMIATCAWQAESLMMLKCAVDSIKVVLLNIQTRHSMTWSQSPPHEMHIHLFFSFFGGGDLVELAMLIIINCNCDETRWSMYSMPTFLSKFCFLVIGLKICCIYHKKGWVSKLHPSFGGNKNMSVTLSIKAG